jgi:hypothetical protein
MPFTPARGIALRWPWIEDRGRTGISGWDEENESLLGSRVDHCHHGGDLSRALGAGAAGAARVGGYSVGRDCTKRARSQAVRERGRHGARRPVSARVETAKEGGLIRSARLTGLEQFWRRYTAQRGTLLVQVFCATASGHAMPGGSRASQVDASLPASVRQSCIPARVRASLAAASVHFSVNRCHAIARERVLADIGRASVTGVPPAPSADGEVQPRTLPELDPDALARRAA